MRIICDRCGSKARIETTREITPVFRRLYCSCTNVECGHTFAMDLTFSHTLSPSALDLPQAKELTVSADNAVRDITTSNYTLMLEAITEEVTYIMQGSKTPEQGMADLAQRVDELLGV